MRSIKIAVIVVLTLILALSSAFSPNLNVYALTGEVGGQTEEEGFISGIVKENNPSLGYLTLYFQDGSGTDPNSLAKLISLRNYTYGYEIPVLRDGATVMAENIQPGDQVFLKLDEDGYILKLSAKSYYKPVYGSVYMKSNRWLVLKKEDGTFTSYPMEPTIPVFKNNRQYGFSDILPGDHVRMLVQTDGDNIDIAGIELEKRIRPVTGIYRGYVEFFNLLHDSLAVSGVQEFINGKWENNSTIGIKSFPFSSDYKARPYSQSFGTVYFATKKANDGSDKIEIASYRNMSNYEMTIKDNLLSLADGNRIELQNTSALIGLDQGTIVIKDGRLVDISALDTLDSVKISMEKSSYGSDYRANIIVSETITQSGSFIYRGRIKSIDAGKSITVESFAQLNGITWSFTNTPKTFDIDLAVSRLLEADGIGNMREMDSSFVGRSVYIVAEGSKIKLISTAPYAESPVSGRVLSMTGGTFDSNGLPLADPTGFVLTEAMVYNTQSHQWKIGSDINMTIPGNAVVIRKGIVGTTSLIKPGDEIRVIRHTQSLEGILILIDE